MSYGIFSMRLVHRMIQDTNLNYHELEVPYRYVTESHTPNVLHQNQSFSSHRPFHTSTLSDTEHHKAKHTPHLCY